MFQVSVSSGEALLYIPRSQIDLYVLTGSLFLLLSGVLCIVSANVPTMAGGAMNEVSALKAGRIHQIAMQNRLPTITFTQSVSTVIRILHKWLDGANLC